jgi:hypothetical protein
MKTIHPVRVVLSFLLLFGLGALSGASFSRGTIQRERAALPAAANDLADRFLAQKQAAYTERLRLSAEQVERMRPALEKTRADLRACRERATRDVWSIMGEHYRALNRVLTPAQREIFQQMIEEKKAEAWPAPR